MTSTLSMDNRVPIEKISEVIVKNDKGEEVKVIKRYQEYQVVVKRNKKVDERKKWKKFGECENKNGHENTSYGDEQFLVLTRGGAEVKEEEKDVVKCRTCKKNHFTAKCPYKDALELSSKPQKSEKDEKTAAAAPNKYVPPNLRTGYSAAPGGSDVPSIMVSNLSQNATEKDLYELFGQFGPVARVSIPKSLEQQSKGFAYVTYNHLDSAEKALKQLNGHRYDFLVLSLEFAKKKSLG